VYPFSQDLDIIIMKDFSAWFFSFCYGSPRILPDLPEIPEIPEIQEFDESFDSAETQDELESDHILELRREIREFRQEFRHKASLRRSEDFRREIRDFCIKLFLLFIGYLLAKFL
jgi:hypothetical protein